MEEIILLSTSIVKLMKNFMSSSKEASTLMVLFSTFMPLDIPEMRSAWMMINSTNMNHLGNEPMNTPMHSVQLQFSRLSERRGEGIQAVCEMQFHC